jgi:hypothetical protein
MVQSAKKQHIIAAGSQVREASAANTMKSASALPTSADSEAQENMADVVTDKPRMLKGTSWPSDAP